MVTGSALLKCDQRQLFPAVQKNYFVIYQWQQRLLLIFVLEIILIGDWMLFQTNKRYGVNLKWQRNEGVQNAGGESKSWKSTGRLV